MYTIENFSKFSNIRYREYPFNNSSAAMGGQAGGWIYFSRHSKRLWTFLKPCLFRKDRTFLGSTQK